MDLDSNILVCDKVIWRHLHCKCKAENFISLADICQHQHFRQHQDLGQVITITSQWRWTEIIWNWKSFNLFDNNGCDFLCAGDNFSR